MTFNLVLLIFKTFKTKWYSKKYLTEQADTSDSLKPNKSLEQNEAEQNQALISGENSF